MHAYRQTNGACFLSLFQVLGCDLCELVICWLWWRMKKCADSNSDIASTTCLRTTLHQYFGFFFFFVTRKQQQKTKQSQKSPRRRRSFSPHKKLLLSLSREEVLAFWNFKRKGNKAEGKRHLERKKWRVVYFLFFLFPVSFSFYNVITCSSGRHMF